MTEPDGTTSYETYEQAPAEHVSLSPWAVISAILAAVGFFTPIVGLRLPIIIAAIVAGHAALHDINRGLKSGKSFATGGLGLAYVGLALTVVIVVAGD